MQERCYSLPWENSCLGPPEHLATPKCFPLLIRYDSLQPCAETSDLLKNKLKKKEIEFLNKSSSYSIAFYYDISLDAFREEVFKSHSSLVRETSPVSLWKALHAFSGLRQSVSTGRI